MSHRRTSQFILAIAVVALGALAPAPGHAATQEFTALGGAVVESDGTLQSPHFTPTTLQVASGDTITWHFGENKNGHKLAVWKTDGEYWETGYAPSGDFSRAFTQGTTVWFRCTVHSQMSEGGGCAGMCGAYTSRTSAPAAPVIGSPAAGSTIQGRTVNFAGHAQPDTYVSIVDGSPQGTSTGGFAADSDGAWSGRLFLGGGSHTISVTATDTLGRVSPKATVTFTLADDKAPTLTIDTPDPALFVVQQPMLLQGTASDNTEIGSIKAKLNSITGGSLGVVEATCTTICQAASVHWQIDFGRMDNNYYYVTMVATDIYGNETSLSTHVVKVG